jgi:peptidoglycan hydrolase-like protein with peptidoglycan-binding domain
VLSALNYRARGLQWLHDALVQGRGSSNLAAATTLVTEPIDRLVTSDVIWHDLFQQPTIASLERLGLPASLAPRSQFFTDLNISAPSSVTALLTSQSAREPALSLGATGPAVLAWQQRLNLWLDHTHAPRIVADGTFGTATQTATKALQRTHSLAPDGVVGPQTRRALTAALAGPTRSARIGRR